MTIEFFNEHYAHLSDTEDASNVIWVLPGVATIADIRAASAGHPKTSSVYPKIGGSGFYISDTQAKFSDRWFSGYGRFSRSIWDSAEPFRS